MKDFFHRDLQLFIDHRFDWERYFRLRGSSTEVAEEVETYRTILRTAGTRRSGSTAPPSSCRPTSSRATRSTGPRGSSV